MMAGCTTSSIIDSYDYNEPDKEDIEPQDSSVNEWIDGVLLREYLYTDEYAEMERDVTLPYDDFLYSTLWSMKTNILDKKVYGATSAELFTNISRTTETKSSFADEESEVGYGFIDLLFTRFKTDTGQYIYSLTFESIYPTSPLDEAGISRSTIILKVDGEYINSSNLNSIAEQLEEPSLGNILELVDNQGRSYNITAREVVKNPIINSQIIEKEGGIKVGYLNYASFNKNFEDELMDELAKFKTAGITDFILDLRRNVGGYVHIARDLSCCIASLTEATPLIYRRYNDTMTDYYKSLSSSYTGLYYNSKSGLFYENANNDASLRRSHLTSLRERRIYVLTTFNTASASELVINTLRGIDFDVVTIGTKSRGKNVGSIESKKSFSSYTYYLLPISMQFYNAKQDGDYSNGINPETKNIIYEGYFLSDYGIGEPLFDRAMEIIMGVENHSTESRSSSSAEPEMERITQISSNTPHGAIDIRR